VVDISRNAPELGKLSISIIQTHSVCREKIFTDEADFEFLGYVGGYIEDVLFPTPTLWSGGFSQILIPIGPMKATKLYIYVVGVGRRRRDLICVIGQ